MNTIKLAQTKYLLINEIKQRWSPRAFSPEKIDKEDLASLFEAMSWAASARNEQPWRLIVGLKNQTPAYEKIYGCLDDWNKKWANTAPVLGIVVAKTHIDNQLNPTAIYDCGAAMATLSIQAANKDIYVHQMGGILKDKIYNDFQISSEEYAVIAGFALGKLGNLDSIDPYYHPMETSVRTRKTPNEFVFGEDWNVPATWL